MHRVLVVPLPHALVARSFENASRSNRRRCQRLPRPRRRFVTSSKVSVHGTGRRSVPPSLRPRAASDPHITPRHVSQVASVRAEYQERIALLQDSSQAKSSTSQAEVNELRRQLTEATDRANSTAAELATVRWPPGMAQWLVNHPT